MTPPPNTTHARPRQHHRPSSTPRRPTTPPIHGHEFSFLKPGIEFIGAQNLINPHSSPRDQWEVKVKIHAVDPEAGTLAGVMEALNAPVRPRIGTQQRQQSPPPPPPPPPLTQVSQQPNYVQIRGRANRETMARTSSHTINIPSIGAASSPRTAVIRNAALTARPLSSISRPVPLPAPSSADYSSQPLPQSQQRRPEHRSATLDSVFLERSQPTSRRLSPSLSSEPANLAAQPSSSSVTTASTANANPRRATPPVETPHQKSKVVTYFEGEVIDFVNFHLWTNKWKASRSIDIRHWSRFQALDIASSRVQRVMRVPEPPARPRTPPQRRTFGGMTSLPPSEVISHSRTVMRVDDGSWATAAVGACWSSDEDEDEEDDDNYADYGHFPDEEDNLFWKDMIDDDDEEERLSESEDEQLQGPVWRPTRLERRCYPSNLKRICKTHILMRWKERFFVNMDPNETSLTIQGFYYVCMRRADGHIEGYYYDPNSSPYQRLLLNPKKQNTGHAFAAYSFA